MAEPIIENDETVTSVNAPAKSSSVEKTVTPVVAPVQPKKGYSIFDDTAGGAVRNVAEKVGMVRPEAITSIKKTYTEDMVPGSATVSKREVFVDKAKIQPYVKTESIFQRSNPAMVKTVEKMVGFRTKNTQGDGYSPFPENATYQDKIDRMNYMGALQYVYKLPSGSIAPYHDIPYETQIAKLIEAPEGYVAPSALAIGTKVIAAGGAYDQTRDATTFEKSKEKGQGRFPEWIPLIGGDKIGVTLDQALGTNFDEVGFNLQIARQYNKILIKAGLNSRQRLAIITERSENKFKNLENILGYARRGGRFAVETGGYILGEGWDMLSDASTGMRDTKERNDFYDVYLDKQANILQDGYAARGIEIDIGTAEIIASMFTSTPQRLAAVASEILIPSGAMTKLVTVLSTRELKKFKNYHLKIKMDPLRAEQTVEESLDTFQAIRNKQFFGVNVGDVPFGVGATYRKIDSIVNGGRIVRGLQIDDAAQTVFKRPEVSAAVQVRRNILKQRDNYVESVRISGKRTLANEKQISKLNNSLNLATQNVRTIVLESNLPGFIRDIASGNKAMIIGASGFGQLAQDQGFLTGGGDPMIAEAIGLFAGIAYDLGSNNRTVSGLLRKVYNFTNASKKDFDFAEELAKRVNTFSPKFKATLEKRIQHIDGIQQNLIAENPNLEPLVKLSFAKLSGLAILQGIEEGARLNISEKSIASFGQTVEDLQQVVNLKTSLLNELANTAQDISKVRRGGDTPALTKFQNTIDKAYEFAKKRNDELQDTIEQLKKAQTNEITDLIKGTAGKLDDGVSSSVDISTKLNNMYAMNTKSVDWANEFNISLENQKISDSVDKALEDKAKTLNKTALTKAANKKVNAVLKKEESPTVEYDNVGDLLLTFSENVRNKSSNKVTQEYLKLDSSKFISETGELIGTEAKVEGIGVLDKFIELIGKNNDTDVLKELAGSNIGKSKQANLFKALDNAAGTTVQKHFDTVNVNGQFENVNEFISSILENAPPGTIKTFLPMNLQVVDVINQTMKKGGKTIDSIPMSFSQLKEMNSAFSNLGSKYKKLQESGSTTAGGISSDYNKLKNETEDMFGKFKVNFGEKNEQLIGNMFVEIGKERVPVKVLLDRAKTMHQTHKSRFFDNSKNWDKAFNGRNKVEPNNIRPTGITLENNPNEWFNFDEIADMNSAKLSEFQNSFFEFLGSTKGKELVIDTGSQNGRALKALMQLKLSDYVSDLVKSGKLNSPEYITKLKNLEVAFMMGRKDGKLESLINVQKAEKDLFGYNPASVGSELWKKGERNLVERMEKLGLENIKPATEYLDQRKQVQNVLQGLTSANAGATTLSQKIFENSGQLKKIKKGLKEFYGSRVSNDRIDKLVRDVYLEDLNENVFISTGKMVANHMGELVPEMTMNLEALKAMTGFGSVARRSQVESIMGEKRLKVFDNMIAFCAEESAIAEKTSNITGIPKHFSVESYISRFYSINRGVISARYVGTEAVLQQFRMKGHNLFKALVENPEAGQLFLEIVKTGQPLSRQKEIVMFNVLSQALNYQNKLNAQNPEREITLPEGWKIKYREYDNVSNT